MEGLIRLKNWIKEKKIEPHFFNGNWAKKYGSAKINNHYAQTLTQKDILTLL